MELLCFTAREAQVLDEVCEAVVPGSRAAGPVLYLDSVAFDLPEPVRNGLRSALEKVAVARENGASFDEIAGFGEFGLLRALAIEAYYSDFRQPGYVGPSAWDVTGYRAAPTALLTKQDWSFLACFRQPTDNGTPS